MPHLCRSASQVRTLFDMKSTRPGAVAARLGSLGGSNTTPAQAQAYEAASSPSVDQVRQGNATAATTALRNGAITNGATRAASHAAGDNASAPAHLAAPSSAASPFMAAATGPGHSASSPALPTADSITGSIDGPGRVGCSGGGAADRTGSTAASAATAQEGSEPSHKAEPSATSPFGSTNLQHQPQHHKQAAHDSASSAAHSSDCGHLESQYSRHVSEQRQQLQPSGGGGEPAGPGCNADRVLSLGPSSGHLGPLTAAAPPAAGDRNHNAGWQQPGAESSTASPPRPSSGTRLFSPAGNAPAAADAAADAVGGGTGASTPAFQQDAELCFVPAVGGGDGGGFGGPAGNMSAAGASAAAAGATASLLDLTPPSSLSISLGGPGAAQAPPVHMDVLMAELQASAGLSPEQVRGARVCAACGAQSLLAEMQACCFAFLASAPPRDGSWPAAS